MSTTKAQAVHFSNPGSHYARCGTQLYPLSKYENIDRSLVTCKRCLASFAADDAQKEAIQLIRRRRVASETVTAFLDQWESRRGNGPNIVTLQFMRDDEPVSIALTVDDLRILAYHGRV